jgi:ATP-dependent Lon protease
LRGKVLPIGGVKEKLLAAHRVGIRTVLLCRDNEKDLADVPPEILSDMVVQFVETMDEVLSLALERPFEASAHPGVPEVATKFESAAEPDQGLTN